jgi:hypothetical protein
MSQETRGQQARKNIKMTMLGQLSKYCPNTFHKMAMRIAFDFNLTPDTVKYNYLSMFLENEILEYNHDNLLVLSAKGKSLQTSEDGLTEQEIVEELQEENENRNQLGKKHLSLEEWVKFRSKRIRPLQR